MAPNGVFRRTEDLDGGLMAAHWDSIVSCEHVLYMYGSIRYKDAFGKSRHINFRYGLTGKDAAVGSFRFAREGNHAT